MKTGFSLVLLASMACLSGGVALGFGMGLTRAERERVDVSAPAAEPSLARHKAAPKQGVAAVASEGAPAASPAKPKKGKRPPKPLPAPEPLADPGARSP